MRSFDAVVRSRCVADDAPLCDGWDEAVVDDEVELVRKAPRRTAPRSRSE
jgi:hypothetical protein